MSRQSLCAILGIFLICPALSPAADEDHRVGRRDLQVRDVDTVIHDQLDRKLPEINFKDNELVDVIDFMRDVTGANIFINWRALKSAGIEKETKISLHLKDVKFEKALATIIEIAGAGKAKLGTEVDEGVITVTTAEDLRQRSTITKTYDIRDLLRGKAQAGKTEQAPVTIPQERVELVMKLVTGTIDSESWRDNGGKIGALKEIHGQLIVTQTKDNQKAIENLLELTRKLMVTEVKDK